MFIINAILDCPFNQEESSCASPCGPVKCIPDDMACATQCVEGCVCPPHTCANETGYCVPVPKGCH